jgi:hypothetical protein
MLSVQSSTVSAAECANYFVNAGYDQPNLIPL